MDSIKAKPMFAVLLKAAEKLKENRQAGKWAPWVIGMLVIAYLVWRIEPKSLLAAFGQARMAVYLPAIIVFVFLSFLIDAQNLQHLLKRFIADYSYAESLIMRGATNLIMVVDYSLGLGSIVYFLNGTRGIPVIRSASIVFFYNYINQLALVLLALIGYPIMNVPAPSWLRDLMAVCLSLTIGTAAAILLLKFSRRSWIQRLGKTEMARPFRESNAAFYAENLTFRVIYYFSYVLFFYIAVRAFRMDIPFGVLVACVPIILLVISVPVSAFGLGTSQAAMLYIFKDYGTQAEILAFSLAYSLSLLVLRTLVGIYFYSVMAGRMTASKQNGEGVDPN